MLHLRKWQAKKQGVEERSSASQANEVFHKTVGMFFQVALMFMLKN